MLKFYVFCVVTFIIQIVFFVTFSDAAECTSEPVKFTKTFTSFTIKSDRNDLTPKNCKYTFSMPKYFIPKIQVLYVKLTGKNRIGATQYSDYGGYKSYNLGSDDDWVLAPTNFTLELSLPEKTPEDRFYIEVYVNDGTPPNTALPFMVKPDLGTIIDSDYVLGNSTMDQQFDHDHPQQASFSIRVVIFDDSAFVIEHMPQIFIYDNGDYKGHLLDVFNAQNQSEPCIGSQFSIVNTMGFSFGTYSILVSPKYDWTNRVYLKGVQNANVTQTFTATDGLTIFHEISSPYGGDRSPSVYQQLAFRGDGNLQVYGGCVAGPQENRRIATITPSNAAAYEKLMLFGRCKTYVLTQGVFQWTKQNVYLTDYRHSIGRKGVIMSDTFPYESVDPSIRSYLIQSPEHENIIVTYEVASLPGDSVFTIDESINANKKQTESLTGASTNLTSPSTYQQMATFTVPKGSDGLLVRYTVTSSSNSVFSSFLLLFSTVFVLIALLGS